MSHHMKAFGVSLPMNIFLCVSKLCSQNVSSILYCCCNSIVRWKIVQGICTLYKNDTLYRCFSIAIRNRIPWVIPICACQIRYLLIWCMGNGGVISLRIIRLLHEKLFWGTKISAHVLEPPPYTWQTDGRILVLHTHFQGTELFFEKTSGKLKPVIYNNSKPGCVKHPGSNIFHPQCSNMLSRCDTIIKIVGKIIWQGSSNSSQPHHPYISEGRCSWLRGIAQNPQCVLTPVNVDPVFTQTFIRCVKMKMSWSQHTFYGWLLP